MHVRRLHKLRRSRRTSGLNECLVNHALIRHASTNEELWKHCIPLRLKAQAHHICNNYTGIRCQRKDPAIPSLLVCVPVWRGSGEAGAARKRRNRTTGSRRKLQQQQELSLLYEKGPHTLVSSKRVCLEPEANSRILKPVSISILQPM